MVSLVSRVSTHVAAFQRSRLGQLVRRYAEDRVDLFAAVVAFNALFSMFPIMLAVLAIVGFFLQDPVTLAHAESLILQALPSAAAADVVLVISSIQQGAGTLGLLSFVGLLWAGSWLFHALEAALDRIYRVPARPPLHQQLMAVGMIFLFAFLVVVLLGATTFAQLIAGLARSIPAVAPGVATGVTLAGLAISLAAAFALCFAIYYFVPNVRLSTRQVLRGSLFAAFALVLLAQVFPIYVSLTGGFSQYGAIFGLFFLLMTWAYLVAQAILIGAELNAYLHPAQDRKRAERRGARDEQPMDGLPPAA